MFLTPLRPHFEELEECEYTELDKRLPAILHVICLVWANSKHYQQPARLVVLLQEFANLIIDIVSRCLAIGILYFIYFMQTKTYVSDEILRMEPDEALEKLSDAEKMCKVFVDVYNDRRKNLATYFKDGPVIEWDFQSTIVFTRFDRFMAKIKQLQARI